MKGISRKPGRILSKKASFAILHDEASCNALKTRHLQ